MAEQFCVAFFGHRYIENILSVEQELEKHVRRLMRKNPFTAFLIGRNGDFDQLAASTVKRCQRAYGNDNSALILMLPYETAEYQNNRASFEQFYDEIELSQRAVGAHPKAAIGLRNLDMADRADLVICYVERENGGAAKAVQYAAKQNKTIINLAHDCV